MGESARTIMLREALFYGRILASSIVLQRMSGVRLPGLVLEELESFSAALDRLDQAWPAEKALAKRADTAGSRHLYSHESVRAVRVALQDTEAANG